MKAVDGRVIPSSDRLLHEFLRRASWTASSSNELTLLRQGKAATEPPMNLESGPAVEIGRGTTLVNITKSGNELTEQGLEIKMSWTFPDQRDVFPWMFLKLTPRTRGHAIIISKGLCAPEAASGSYQESWNLTPSERIPEGDYGVEALFVDNTRRSWAAKSGQRDAQTSLLVPALPLGDLKVTVRKSSSP
jgi:hypothetical protein